MYRSCRDTLVERASHAYSKEFLWDCTLYTTAEPCAMCSGAIYWGNIGHVVYAMTEKDLLSLTGADPQNPTFDLLAATSSPKVRRPLKSQGLSLNWHLPLPKFTKVTGINKHPAAPHSL